MVSKKIIHICQDEKFINQAKYQFNELYHNSNLYYVVVKDKSQALRFVSNDIQTHVIDRDDLNLLSNQLPKDTIIVFHSIIPQFYDFIFTTFKSYTLIWIFFGMEIYNDNSYYKSRKLYDKSTKSYLTFKKVPIKKRIKRHIRPYARIIKRDLPLDKFERKQSVLNKFSYIGVFYKEEFDNICKLGNIKYSRHLKFTYYPLENIVNCSEKISSNKSVIMIGNSGHPTSNHIDVLNKIEKFNLDDWEILLSLSYGNKIYVDKLLDDIQKLDFNKITCLKDFLPIDDYNTYLKKVAIFILYTKRQQGVGNTIALLWHGAKVFLSKRNTFYHYLKRIGILVYCYETELNKENLKDGLSIDEIKHNRNLLHQELNEKRLLKELKEQLDFILENQQIHPE